jgi:hypothetical protein
MDQLQTIVPRVLAELLRSGPMSQGKLEIAWRAAVGESLSRVTTVRLQPNGLVEVLPSDSRWNRELKRSSSMILTRLKGLLGSDNVLRVSVLGK